MNKREQSRLKRHRRIRLAISGSNERPRLLLRRSLKNLSASVINDSENKILLSLSTSSKALKSKFPAAGNVAAATRFGELFASMAKEKGVSKIVFDRAGCLFHGRVKAFADALRKGGLQF